MIRSKIVQNGDLYSICVPYTVLEQAGITGEVEMIVEGDRLIIHAAGHAGSDVKESPLEAAVPAEKSEKA
jgi:hypothetical protein